MREKRSQKGIFHVADIKNLVSVKGWLFFSSSEMMQWFLTINHPQVLWFLWGQETLPFGTVSFEILLPLNTHHHRPFLQTKSFWFTLNCHVPGRAHERILLHHTITVCVNVSHSPWKPNFREECCLSNVPKSNPTVIRVILDFSTFPGFQNCLIVPHSGGRIRWRHADAAQQMCV